MFAILDIELFKKWLLLYIINFHILAIYCINVSVN